MIAQKFEYTAARTLDEALGALAEGAKPLAGGMSLIPMMKLRLAGPDRVVDIARLAELNYIREESGRIHVGAAVTHHEVCSSDLLRGRSPLLSETASNIGDIQVRNMGTIGGSIAHADPAADYPAALLALDANITLRSSSGARSLPAADFFVDTFTTALEPGELVVEVDVPADGAAVGSAYCKMVQPASGFAIVGVAARVQRVEGRIRMARIGVTGMAPRAFRATEAEAALEGKTGSPDEIQAAAALIPSGQDANSDLHASADYRKQMALIYGGRAILQALARIA